MEPLNVIMNASDSQYNHKMSDFNSIYTLQFCDHTNNLRLSGSTYIIWQFVVFLAFS